MELKRRMKARAVWMSCRERRGLASWPGSLWLMMERSSGCGEERGSSSGGVSML